MTLPRACAVAIIPLWVPRLSAWRSMIHREHGPLRLCQWRWNISQRTRWKRRNLPDPIRDEKPIKPREILERRQNMPQQQHFSIRAMPLMFMFWLIEDLFGSCIKPLICAVKWSLARISLISNITSTSSFPPSIVNSANHVTRERLKESRSSLIV